MLKLKEIVNKDIMNEDELKITCNILIDLIGDLKSILKIKTKVIIFLVSIIIILIITLVNLSIF